MMKQAHINNVRAYVSHIQLSILVKFSILCAFILLSNYVFIDEEVRKTQNIIQTTGHIMTNPFTSLDIEAEAVYVLDVKNNEVLYSRKEHNVYPLASITKIATALTANKITGDNSTVRLSPETIKVDGDNGLLVQENWKLSDLLDFTLLVSSNDGAQGIASVAGALISHTEEENVNSFVDEMNKLAKDIGLKKTRFYNPSGLDIDDFKSGGYGTAEDVAKIMAYTIEEYPELLETTKKTKSTFVSLDNVEHHATNTNPSVSKIPGILASKTGYTDQSGGNLVIAFDPFPGRPLVVVVLGSTYTGRFDDVDKLSFAALELIRQIDK